MTTPDFLRSLSVDQTSALNDLLLEQRTLIQTDLSQHVAELTTAHKAAIAELSKGLTATRASLVEKDAYIARVSVAEQAIVKALENSELDDAGTVQEIAGVLEEAKKPEVEKKKAALAEEIAKKQAELDALEA